MIKRMTDLSFRRKFFRACLYALIITSIISIWRAVIAYDSKNSLSLYLSVSLRSPEDGVAALYYDVGQGFNVNHVVPVSIKGDEKVIEYLFEMPNETIYNLRWDPPPLTHALISIQKMEVLDGSLMPLRRLSLRQLEPLHQIRLVALTDAKADFQIQEEANDPQIKIRLESPLSAEMAFSPLMIAGRYFLEFLGLFLCACLLIFIWFCWKDKVVATVIVMTLVFFGWRCWTAYDDTGYLFLQAAMSSSVDGTSQVYYNTGQGLSEDQSQRMPITSQENLKIYRFKLPNKTIYDMRFDPQTTAGSVRIGEMKVTDACGNLLREIPLQQLAPINQIKSISAKDDGIEVVIPENANDPQMAIPLIEALDYEGKLPFPMWQWILALTGELVLCILFVSVFILVWKKRDIVSKRIESSFVQEKLPLIYLGSAFGLILAMAAISGLDVHPDEWNGHVKAAGYYVENWLPPAVDDPRVVKEGMLSLWGFSYLFYIDVIYFLAVKATQFLSGIVPEFYLRLRLANAFLFLLLIITFTFKIRRVQWTVLFLIMTPQLWYIFSYFNNDAFPLCISMLLALQIVDSESSLNRFLVGSNIRINLGKGVCVGILVGLLLMSKLNYWIYIGFIGFVGLWEILFVTSADHRFELLKKWIFVGCIALSVYLPFYGYSEYINNFNKSEKIGIVMEEHAAPQFKPSTLQKDPSSTYPGLRLRDKGRSFQEVIIQNPYWWELSLKSFVGLYGYMQFLSDSDYYQVMAYAFGAFFVLVFLYVALTRSAKDMMFFLFVLFFVFLTLGMSTYHSWVNDYEPQGRYLFPILPMLMVGLGKLPTSFRKRVIPPFCFVFFVLSVWSFLLTGLKIIPKIN